MINSFLYICFYIFVLLSGRGLVILIQRFSQKKYLDISVLNYPIWIFYPFIYLFFIGNAVVILNFFIGTSNNIVIIFLVLPILLNLKNIKRIKFKLADSGVYFITLFLLGFSTNTITFHQDSASYHLSYQQFIRSEKIVLGLSNLHIRYGFSSLSDYIGSFFWFNENFIFLHFINLIFVSTFYIFLIWLIFNTTKLRNKVLVLIVTIYGILDNFGIEGGKNGFFDIDTIGKQDGAFGILFFFSNIFIFKYIYNEIKFSNRDLYFLIFLILFSIQFRIFGYSLIFGLLIIVYKYWKLINYKIFTYPLIIGLIWILKNFLITSCFVFPVPITCLNVKWSNSFLIKSQSEELRYFHRAWNFGNESIVEWYIKWSERYLNYYISLNFLLSLVILSLLLVIIFKLKNKINKSFLISLVYLILLIFLWILSAPSIRFGYGVYLTLLIFLSYLFVDFRFNLTKNIFNSREILTLLILSSVLATPLVDNYTLQNNNFEIRSIVDNKLKYIKNPNNWGYSVDSNEKNALEFCWINKDCIPPVDYEIKEYKIGNYRMIIVDEFS